MTKKDNLISSVLYVTASTELDKEVEADLLVEDNEKAIAEYRLPKNISASLRQSQSVNSPINPIK